MQYKNIIFDLGNVLVKLNPEGCIGAFKAIGMGELVEQNPQSEGMKLMSKLGVGMMTTEAFCDAARELTGADVTNEEIIDAANKMLVEIPDEKKKRLLQLKKAGYRLFLLSNTIDCALGLLRGASLSLSEPWGRGLFRAVLPLSENASGKA